MNYEQLQGQISLKMVHNLQYEETITSGQASLGHRQESAERPRPGFLKHRKLQKGPEHKYHFFIHKEAGFDTNTGTTSIPFAIVNICLFFSLIYG